MLEECLRDPERMRPFDRNPREVLRYARSIILERGDFNGRVLSIRRDDLRAICSLLHSTETQTLQQLRDWDALVETL